MTAIVGPNGSSKSSILRAIQGCPDSYNVGNYWFSTALDVIGNQPSRYIHTYNLPSGASAEVIKSRVLRKGRRPDYFETSAPRLRDGMLPMPKMEETPQEDLPFRSATRWKSIEKDVVYVDFRQELSAYDIYFHFGVEGKGAMSLADKKSLIRRRAKHISAAMSSRVPSYNYYGSDRIVSRSRDLSREQVAAVSRILGREYQAIRIMRHRFFGVEGATAKLRSESLEYSEAFAGSGEFAAVVLVDIVSAAADKALVVLDEPEVSLHPGAQRELMRYVARQAVLKKLQVVVSTHSPSIIAELPKSAIKVVDQVGGKVHLVSHETSPQEAFQRIGHEGSPSRVYVEDPLARAIVERAARLVSTDLARSLDIEVAPGGAGTIMTRVVPVLASVDADVLVVLDGDQAPSAELKASSSVSDSDLEEELGRLGLKDKHLLRNGGSGDSGEEALARRRQVYSWIVDNVRFLPGSSPESLLGEMCGEPISEGVDAKAAWLKVARAELGLEDGELVPASEILATQKRRLAMVEGSTHPMAEAMRLIRDRF
ncbi:hypothetical protein N866_14555 [Actinotalea ferrariae CF5-4]|uniref:ATPase AAA-type core domain-containing protein n=1 Tax=Actinotalea ferrariae CF5-4 TaxID=948458 RepID=A0A021VLE0_9CELL|nr:hypothetical protein N866_14555 [Actinotalea ferrariae CF5-4]